MIKRNSRGDTIIEVMFAMTIIGVVLAAAYATASKNLQTSQLSKERIQATNIAESQLEQLKVIKDLQLISNGEYCVDVTKASPMIPNPIDAPSEECKEEPFYEKRVTKTGNQYKLVVEWVPPGGQESNMANVTLYYSDFDYSSSGSSRLAVFTRSKSSDGSTYVLGSTIDDVSGNSRRGVVYSTSRNMTIDTPGATIVDADISSTDFETTITVDPNTVYYVRVFVLNQQGTYEYSSVITINEPSESSFNQDATISDKGNAIWSALHTEQSIALVVI